jgi:hypothetical protein
MIKHIVIWKFQEQGLEDNRQEAKHLLERLPDLIDVIQEYEVGINFNYSERSLDMVLISSFNSKADLATYSAHPAHQEVVDYLRGVTEYARVVDYQV